MYLVSSPELSKTIPVGATFWTPQGSDINEEGFGYFRDVFDLRGTSAKEARSYLRAHQRVLHFVDDRARSAEEFDKYAQAFEAGDAADVGLSGIVADQIDDLVTSEDCDLGGLELGVGALAYALSAAKTFPAASCRSHIERTWSPFPVLYLAANQPRSLLLEELVGETNCGFVQDTNRPDFIVIAAPSLQGILDLAQTVVDHLARFKALTARKQNTRTVGTKYVQPSMLDG